MKKILTKVAEMYAKATANSCAWWAYHQPKAPRCLIKK